MRKFDDYPIVNFWKILKTIFKVAHYTWITFQKSGRNSLIIKNVVTYHINECTKSK